MPHHAASAPAAFAPSTGWDCPEEGTSHHITSLHPYPARFIPAIPRTAIGLYGRKAGTVWDPFAGCGTTLVEAKAAGLEAVGIDVNPLACLLQRAFTTPIQRTAWRSLGRFHRRLLRPDSIPSFNDSMELRGRIPALTHWFGEGSIRALDGYLRLMERSELSESASDIAKLALSRVAVRLSRQQSDTQYRAVRPDVATHSAFEILAESLQIVIAALLPYLESQAAPPTTVRMGDARYAKTYEGLPRPDLVITSPPYPNSYEYWLYHKYRMFWLDMDPIWARSREIGARPFYSGTGKLGPSDFLSDLRSVLEGISAHAKPSTTQVWIVGDGIIKGTRFDTAAGLLAEAEDQGWSCIQRFERRVARGRSSFQGIGRLKTESILVLRQTSARLD
jgi:hypothetical protein